MTKTKKSNTQKVNKKTKNKTYLIGIVSIIFGIYIPPIGIVFGNIGQKKAKKEGHSGGLSRIGSLIGIAMTVLYIVVLIWALFTFELFSN